MLSRFLQIQIISATILKIFECFDLIIYFERAQLVYMHCINIHMMYATYFMVRNSELYSTDLKPRLL